MKELFNDNWFFSLQKLSDKFSLETIKEKHNWQRVDIPHDWLIDDVNNLYGDSEGWYKKEFKILELQRTLLYFDGIYRDCEVYLNGTLVKNWKNGYTSFLVDISDYIRLGDNTIWIRVKFRAPNSRWYTGAGIYRNVWIEQTKEDYILPNGIYFSTKYHEERQWSLIIDTKMRVQQTVTLAFELSDKNKKLITLKKVTLKPNTSVDRTKLNVKNPELWDIENPQLYRLKVSIMKNGRILDYQTHAVGFKNIVFTSDEGMFLNNKHLKIHGVCLHHDLGCLGSAFSYSALQRQLLKLKEMGVNAIRTAHNPAAPELFDLADEMGFLIQSEFSDVWKHKKTEYDYSNFFEEWVEEDMKSWVSRDRNHPSLFMWSIGNEIYDTHGRKDGFETTVYLKKLTQNLDYMNNAAITFGSNYLGWKPTQKAANELDLIGYNYGENLYENHHKNHPKWIIYGSETCATVQSRGVYHFPFSENILTDDDWQCSSLGNSSTSWGTKSIETCINDDQAKDFSLGQFLWSGIDYIGEPTPYHTKNSYFGQLDTAVLAKDSYYIFQAAWIDFKKKPMIHIFPYWDYNHGQEIDVRVCSNLPIIELFLNEKSLGKRKTRTTEGKFKVPTWHISYKEGTLIAKGYTDNNQLICQDIQSSFGNSNKISVSVNRKEIAANGQDFLFVEISAIDGNGNFVRNACDKITVEVDGPGRLLGLDNGDSSDFDQYKTNSRRLFSGKLVAVVAPTFSPGTINIKCSAQGLDSQSISVTSYPSTIAKGTSNALNGVKSNENKTQTNDILIRKINLSVVSPFDLKHPDHPIIITADILPESASYQELFWRVTDEKGIDSRVCDYHVERNKIKVFPKGNGEIFIRCGIKNGKKHIDRYSMIQATITGLDDILLSAYDDISAGLYTRSNVSLTSGNDRGVATLRGTESWVTFENIDFEKEGSDELSLWLFPLEDNSFPIEIWIGSRDNDKNKYIDTVFYTKGSLWNTYQKQNFKLKEKISGINTITLVFKQKVHIQKLKFVKISKGYNSIKASDYDVIYGDSYKLKENVVEKIGNNVTLRFNNFYLRDGAKQIQLVGRSVSQRNTIRLKISNSKNQKIELLEFPKENKYKLHFFDINVAPGVYNVEFIFLPGSNFDFDNFKFLKFKEEQNNDHI